MLIIIDMQPGDPSNTRSNSQQFLTAEWRKLAMVNYVIDPVRLQSYVPAKTELDFWNGRCYISLVAFMFVNTVVKGCRIPFHRNFEEVNLRFYVRYKHEGEWRRGVVFIREFVPLPMVTLVANTLYQERYRTISMKHSFDENVDTVTVNYEWKRLKWHALSVTGANQPALIAVNSEEEFITQHFWGYSRKRNHTSEYHVDHERWLSYPVMDYRLHVDYTLCYGEAFSFINGQQPHSVFLVEGSPVSVYKDRIL